MFNLSSTLFNNNLMLLLSDANSAVQAALLVAISVTMAGAFIGAGVAMSNPLGAFVEKALEARSSKESEASASDFLADLILGIAFAESIILLGVLVSAALTSLV